MSLAAIVLIPGSGPLLNSSYVQTEREKKTEKRKRDGEERAVASEENPARRADHRLVSSLSAAAACRVLGPPRHKVVGSLSKGANRKYINVPSRSIPGKGAAVGGAGSVARGQCLGRKGS